MVAHVVSQGGGLGRDLLAEAAPLHPRDARAVQADQVVVVRAELVGGIVATRSIAAVEVREDSCVLQRGQAAVERGEVDSHADAYADLLGREGAVPGGEGLQHGAFQRGQSQAPAPEGGYRIREAEGVILRSCFAAQGSRLRSSGQWLTIVSPRGRVLNLEGEPQIFMPPSAMKTLPVEKLLRSEARNSTI